MFGDLMGGMEEKQNALHQKLSETMVEGDSGDGTVIVTANCVRQITNISINVEMVQDMEQMEDLILVAVNRALEKAMEIETQESQALLNEIMPPGMDDMLSGLI